MVLACRVKSILLGFGAASTIYGIMIFAKKPAKIGSGIIKKS